MAIKFACSSCGKRLTAKEEHVGRRSKCPKCGSEIQVPALLTWEEDTKLEQPSSPPMVPALPGVASTPMATKPINDGHEPETPKPEGAQSRGAGKWAVRAVAFAGLIASVLVIANTRVYVRARLGGQPVADGDINPVRCGLSGGT